MRSRGGSSSDPVEGVPHRHPARQHLCQVKACSWRARPRGRRRPRVPLSTTRAALGSMLTRATTGAPTTASTSAAVDADRARPPAPRTGGADRSGDRPAQRQRRTGDEQRQSAAAAGAAGGEPARRLPRTAAAPGRLPAPTTAPAPGRRHVAPSAARPPRQGRGARRIHRWPRQTSSTRGRPSNRRRAPCRTRPDRPRPDPADRAAARLASNVADAAATTVVPLPPLTDQHRIITPSAHVNRPPHGGLPSVGGSRPEPLSGWTRPTPSATAQLGAHLGRPRRRGSGMPARGAGASPSWPCTAGS